VYLISELFRSERKTCSRSIVRYTNRIGSIAKWTRLVGGDHKFLCNYAYTLVNLIINKISKIGATRRQILRLKCTKIDFFSAGAAPDPTGGAYSTPPDPLAVFKGPTSKGKEGEGKRGGNGKEGEGMGRMTLHTPCCKFLATPLERFPVTETTFEGNSRSPAGRQIICEFLLIIYRNRVSYISYI